MSFRKVIALVSLLSCFNLIQAQNPCEGLHNVFVNDYADCSRYFSCWLGNAVSITCPDGRYFAMEPLGCHPAGTVPCERCPPEGIFSFAVVGSCTAYTLCINGNSLDRECSTGARFDPTEGTCKLRDLVPCEYEICPPTGNHLIRDPASCSHYFVCFNGGSEDRRSCAPNLLFDETLGICAPADTVTCDLEAFNIAPAVPTVPVVVPTAPTARPITK